MQNNIEKDKNVIGIGAASKPTSNPALKGMTSPLAAPRADVSDKIVSIQPASLSDILVIKKDGTREEYNVQKVVSAVQKSATRMLVNLTNEEIKTICDFVDEKIMASGKKEIEISTMHNIVESVLELVNPRIAASYRNYRNYKQDFVHMLDKVYQESQKIMYIGDKENSNSDSALVSTKRSLIFNQLNKELYKKFFLTVDDLQAIREGYIYIHDMSARRDTMNCCLFDVKSVLEGGFEMGNIWYNEPKTLDVAFDVIGDIVMAAASQQYGGFTVPEVDKLLAPYAQKTYDRQYNRYLCMGLSFEKAREEALKDVQNDYEQGYQGWEYKFNTVASSRGDYPFITITLGLGSRTFTLKDKVKKVTRNLYYSLKLYSYMTKNYMEKDKNFTTYLQQVLNVLKKLCTQTGYHFLEKAM